jgi:hypothetical protein
VRRGVLPFGAGVLVGVALAGLAWAFLREDGVPAPAAPGEERASAGSAQPVLRGAVAAGTDAPAPTPYDSVAPALRELTRSDREPASPIPAELTAALTAGQGTLRVRINESGWFTGNLSAIDLLLRPQPPAAALLERAVERTNAWEGPHPTAADVEAWLASGDAASVESGLAWALRVQPVPVEALRRLAAGPSAGLLRGAAVLALARSGSEGSDVAGVLATLARDGDPHVADALVESLGSLGAAGGDVAAAIAESGSYAESDVASLAAALAAAKDPVARVAALRDPALLSATLEELGKQDEGRRAGLREVLPGLVRRLLAEPDPGRIGAPILAWTVKVGRGDVLAEVALDARLPATLRDAALGSADPTARWEILRRDPDLSALGTRRALRLLEGLWPQEVAAPGVASALWRLADDHADPRVREAAREQLQSLEPADAGDLAVHRATYGTRGRTVDVTAVLRRRLVRGRLSLVASNDLAGDPHEGVPKVLVVEYSWRGARNTRTVGEGGRLVLP